MTTYNRREIGKAFGAATAMVAAGEHAFRRAAKAAPMDLELSARTSNGAAPPPPTRVEGAVHEDGRGQTNWDIFSHTPGKVINGGSTGDVACDSYHLYAEDTKLLKNLGVVDLSHVARLVAHLPRRQGQAQPEGRRSL